MLGAFLPAVETGAGAFEKARTLCGPAGARFVHAAGSDLGLAAWLDHRPARRRRCGDGPRMETDLAIFLGIFVCRIGAPEPGIFYRRVMGNSSRLEKGLRES